jgi:hypothetical protein
MLPDWLQVVIVLALAGVLLLWTHPWARRRPRRAPGLRPPGNGVECEVIPRRDANPGQLKALADALDRWIADHAVPSVTTSYALADLRAGELPQPLSVAFERYLDDHLAERGGTPPSGTERGVRHRAILDKLGSMARGRTVFVHVRDAREAAETLRRCVPAELVEDILIDHRSWEERA